MERFYFGGASIATGRNSMATVFGADLVVSWTFKHIVHFEKIEGYEGVNSLRGYRSPKNYSPREVVKN
jgi:hypothetical protein